MIHRFQGSIVLDPWDYKRLETFRQQPSKGDPYPSQPYPLEPLSCFTWLALQRHNFTPIDSEQTVEMWTRMVTDGLGTECPNSRQEMPRKCIMEVKIDLSHTLVSAEPIAAVESIMDTQGTAHFPGWLEERQRYWELSDTSRRWRSPKGSLLQAILLMTPMKQKFFGWSAQKTISIIKTLAKQFNFSRMKRRCGTVEED